MSNKMKIEYLTKELICKRKEIEIYLNHALCSDNNNFYDTDTFDEMINELPYEKHLVYLEKEVKFLRNTLRNILQDIDKMYEYCQCKSEFDIGKFYDIDSHHVEDYCKNNDNDGLLIYFLVGENIGRVPATFEERFMDCDVAEGLYIATKNNFDIADFLRNKIEEYSPTSLLSYDKYITDKNYRNFIKMCDTCNYENIKKILESMQQDEIDNILSFGEYFSFVVLYDSYSASTHSGSKKPDTERKVVKNILKLMKCSMSKNAYTHMAEKNKWFMGELIDIFESE